MRTLEGENGMENENDSGALFPAAGLKKRTYLVFTYLPTNLSDWFFPEDI